MNGSYSYLIDDILFYLFSTITIAVTALPYSKAKHWLVRVWDFPRVQILVIACLLFLISPAIDSQHPVILHTLQVFLLISIFDQIRYILPFTFIFKPELAKSTQPQNDATVSLLISNVLMTNRNASPLISLIEGYKPDLVLTLETDQWWDDQLKHLENIYPYSYGHPLDNLYGLHLYSSLPTDNIEIKCIIQKDIPSIHGSFELKNGKKVKFHFLHPAPPSPTENEKSTQRDTELLVTGKSIDVEKNAYVVAGDLNDVAWSRSTRLFKKCSGLLDPRVGRGFFNSFNAKQPLFRWPLDHIFVSNHFKLVDIQRLPDVGSDHFPIFIRLEHCAKDKAN